MKIYLTKAWSVAPHGHTVVTYPAGTELTGRLAELALVDGAAKISEDEIEAATMTDLEIKIEPQVEKKRRGRPPRNREQHV